MAAAGVQSRRDLEDRLVARASKDQAFLAKLKTDPRAAVAEETGITVPESMTIEVLEETPDKGYLVIPSSRVALSDEALDVAGGATYGDVVDAASSMGKPIKDMV
jgi:hypothetical protein